MQKNSILLAALALGLTTATMHAQADPTATRPAGIQAGVTYSNANTDEFDKRIGGISIFADYDFAKNLGVEADVRLLTLQTPYDFAERSYMAGLRYSRHFGRFQPFIRATGGIGQTVRQSQYLGYAPNTPGTFGAFAVGGGLDYRLSDKIRLRGEYEQQFWPGFTPDGLSPSVISVGAAYHFRFRSRPEGLRSR